MATYNFIHSATSIILRVSLKNSSTGQGITGLTSSSAGLIIGTITDVESTSTNYTVAASNVETVTTLGTYAAPTSGKCRFREVDATNHKGLYEIHLANARYSVSNAKYLTVSVSGATNLKDESFNIDLSNIPSNIKQIDEQATNGNNATLNLKCLNVVNNAGDAVNFQSTGSNGNGLEISGNGSGAALRVVGGATGAAATFTGGSTSGAGISVSTTDGIGLNINATAGTGLYVSSGSTHAIQAVAAASGTNHAFRLVSGDTGNAIHGVGGTSSGNGLFLSGATSVLHSNIVTQIQSGLFLAASYTSPLDAAGTRSALGLASANLDTQLDALPTAAEIRTEMDSNSTQLAAISSDTLQLITNTAAILADTGTDGVVVASGSKSGYALSSTGLDSVTSGGVSVATAIFRNAVVLWGNTTGTGGTSEVFVACGITMTSTNTGAGTDRTVAWS